MAYFDHEGFPRKWFQVSLISPSGEWGCVNFWVGQLNITFGFIPRLFGGEIYWGNREIITLPRSQSLK